MKKHSVMTGLRSLRVRDVMNRNIIKVGTQQRMVEIAKMFLDRDISAASVIDDYGRCVGIVSATDFLRRDTANCGPATVPLQNAPHISQSSKHNECCAIASDERDVASSYMTSSVQTISADALLFTAAMMMTSEHIHHLPVLDEQNNVVGMMSTMDVATALVNAMDEFDLPMLKRMDEDPEC